MSVNGRGKRSGFGAALSLAALVLGVVGCGAAAVWLRDGETAAGVLASVLLTLAVLAGPVRGLRAYSRMRLEAVLDRFADDRAPRRREGSGTGPDPERHAA